MLGLYPTMASNDSTKSIQPSITFSNFEVFKLELINCAAGKSTGVVQSIKDEVDYTPPAPPGINATPAEISLL